MNKARTTCTLITAIAALTTITSRAQSWQTVDSFSFDPTFSSAATDISTGSDGLTLYSAGWAAFDSAENNSGAVVRKSTDSGATWTTVDDYFESGWTSGWYREVSPGAGNIVFAGGELWDSATLTKAWIVRESTDAGATWETIDAYTTAEGGKPSCGDVKVNPYTGDIFAVGRDNADASQGFYWLVRKKAANALQFETVDRIGTPPGNDANAVGFHPTAGIFVVGFMGVSGRNVWTVRKSTNQGTSWTTVDSFQDAAKTNSEAVGIAVTSSGTIYVCGKAVQSVKGRLVNNWVVRRSLDGGATWAVVDRYGAEPAPYGSGLAHSTGITVTNSGTVYVTGATADPSHMVVRKGITSNNGVMTWTTVDDFQLAPGLPSKGISLTSDIAGNLFVAGNGQLNGSGLLRYIVRKAANP